MEISNYQKLQELRKKRQALDEQINNVEELVRQDNEREAVKKKLKKAKLTPEQVRDALQSSDKSRDKSESEL